MIKIMIIDDEVTSRAVLSKAVQSQGYCAICASDGYKALQLFADNPDISLIIVDMQMPECDGRQFVNKFTSILENRAIPIILISGIISLKDIVDLLENGVARFLPKPVKNKDLLEYIDLLLKGKLVSDDLNLVHKPLTTT